MHACNLLLTSTLEIPMRSTADSVPNTFMGTGCSATIYFGETCNESCNDTYFYPICIQSFPHACNLLLTSTLELQVVAQRFILARLATSLATAHIFTPYVFNLFENISTGFESSVTTLYGIVFYLACGGCTTCTSTTRLVRSLAGQRK
jgi:hypothetical protein